MKLALIAIDGLDPRVLYDNKDILPNFREIIENSMHGSWNTPGHTIPSFTATLTGMQYSETDFYWDKEDGGYQRHRQTGFEFMWEKLDCTQTYLNLPTVYPPEDVEDGMVTGFVTPADVGYNQMTMNDRFAEILEQNDYRVDVDAGTLYDEVGGEAMVDELEEMMDTRTTVASELSEEFDSDLFYSVWTAPDRWFHQCKLHGEDYLPLYMKTDEILGSVLKFIPDDVPKIFFSDHGFAHFDGDDGVHKGHMYDGWYAVMDAPVPNYRDDSASIFDLFPTVLNYFSCEIPDTCRGRIMFENPNQKEEMEQSLKDLGYME